MALTRPRLQRWIARPLGAAVILLMLPGFGLRTWAAHIHHWSDERYNHPAFVRAMLRDLPPDGVFLVDVSLVFDVHLSGRKTVLALDIRRYFKADTLEYDYLIVGRTGLAQQLPQRLGGKRTGTYGVVDDPFACYAEVYSARPKDRPASP